MSEEITTNEVGGTPLVSFDLSAIVQNISGLIGSLTQMLQMWFQLYIQFYMMWMTFSLFRELFATLRPPTGGGG